MNCKLIHFGKLLLYPRHGYLPTLPYDGRFHQVFGFIMTLSIGQILRGRTASYQITNALKAPTVFKAKILSCDHPTASQTEQL